MKSSIFLTILGIAVAAARPGLLRVPKVYNAVITSDQNLSPSRAYPVIQPVIHRTAVGYVPPFYYTQIAPQIAGPEIVHLPYGTKSQATEPPAGAEKETASGNEAAAIPPVSPKPEDDEMKTKIPKDQDPSKALSFYPNYRSLYYDPYFYAYNGFNPHPSASTYYLDYQPYGPLEPLPPSAPPKNPQDPAPLFLPSYHEEEKQVPKGEVKEKIPDVPPPPLPTAVPKSS